MESSSCFPRAFLSRSRYSAPSATTVEPNHERRQSSEAVGPSSQQEQVIFCATCGRTLAKHQSSPTDGEDNPAFTCSFVRGGKDTANSIWPVVDVRELLYADERAVAMPTDTDLSSVSRAKLPKGHTSTDLVAVVDPRLTLATRALIHAQFGASSAAPAWPDLPLGFQKLSASEKHGGGEIVAFPSRASVEDALAPYAQLALLIRPLVRRLVNIGLDQMRRDDEDVVLPVNSGNPDNDSFPSLPTSNEKNGVKRLLTPSHVLRAIKLDRQLALAFGKLAFSEADTTSG
jgi:hypothetical protein